jgi:hypothetical protein
MNDTAAGYYNQAAYVGLTLPVLCWVIVANSLTIAAIARNPQLRTKTYYLVSCLAIVDLALGITYMVIFPINVIVNSKALLSLDAGLTLCATIISIWVGSAMNSLYHLVVIAFDRFIAVHYALRYESMVTEQRQRGLVIISWLVSHLQGFTIFAWREELHPHCISGIMLPPPAFILPMVVIPIYACALIITVLYIKIFAVARSQMKRINQVVPSNQQNQEQEMLRVMTKQAKMFFMIIGIFMRVSCPLRSSSWQDSSWAKSSFLGSLRSRPERRLSHSSSSQTLE